MYLQRKTSELSCKCASTVVTVQRKESYDKHISCKKIVSTYFASWCCFFVSPVTRALPRLPREGELLRRARTTHEFSAEAAVVPAVEHAEFRGAVQAGGRIFVGDPPVREKVVKHEEG
jgi:hypothetical protein